MSEADALRATLAARSEPDATAMGAVAQRASEVLRPAGALERLDEIAIWLAGWQRTARPEVRAPAALVFVGDHGVASEGVSAYPASVTAEMLRALRDGRATASVLARELGATLVAVDVGVRRPTGHIGRESAMDADWFDRCLAAGRRAVADSGADLLVVGEMGIGNTTAASAVCAVLFGQPPARWVGRGTGIDDAALARKRRVVAQARRRLSAVRDPLEILRQVGGSELAALAGAVVEARRRSIPVILDGFVVTAAVAPLWAVERTALAHCLAGHVSAEAGHRRLLRLLGLRPLLDLGLRLGEGSGGLAAMALVRLAAAAVTDVATFDEWGIGS